MKELTKKILESGLVDKHLAIAMERWGALERGDADVVGASPVTKDTFEKFAEDIALLVDAEEPIKETIIDSLAVSSIHLKIPNREFQGAVDEMGRIVINGDIPESILREMIGEKVEAWVEEGGNHYFYRVSDFERVYLGDEVAAVRLALDPPVPKD